MTGLLSAGGAILVAGILGVIALVGVSSYIDYQRHALANADTEADQ